MEARPTAMIASTIASRATCQRATPPIVPRRMRPQPPNALPAAPAAAAAPRIPLPPPPPPSLPAAAPAADATPAIERLSSFAAAFSLSILAIALVNALPVMSSAVIVMLTSFANSFTFFRVHQGYYFQHPDYAGVLLENLAWQTVEPATQADDDLGLCQLPRFVDEFPRPSDASAEVSPELDPGGERFGTFTIATCHAPIS